MMEKFAEVRRIAHVTDEESNILLADLEAELGQAKLASPLAESSGPLARFLIARTDRINSVAIDLEPFSWSISRSDNQTFTKEGIRELAKLASSRTISHSYSVEELNCIRQSFRSSGKVWGTGLGACIGGSSILVLPTLTGRKSLSALLLIAGGVAGNYAGDGLAQLNYWSYINTTTHFDRTVNTLARTREFEFRTSSQLIGGALIGIAGVAGFSRAGKIAALSGLGLAIGGTLTAKQLGGLLARKECEQKRTTAREIINEWIDSKK
ncbi:MAG: hypothetical protein K2W95_34030 [Candidatus Obscuribacterales bacterium]|nr:hypothetical protein [Candidatus Obscuribacterales bacterium]